jgi:hypothetical protein
VAEGNPVKVRLRLLSSLLELGKSFFLNGHDRDLVAKTPGALQSKERESAVTSDKTDPAHPARAALARKWPVFLRQSDVSLSNDSGTPAAAAEPAGLSERPSHADYNDGCEPAPRYELPAIETRKLVLGSGRLFLANQLPAPASGYWN